MDQPQRVFHSVTLERTLTDVKYFGIRLPKVAREIFLLCEILEVRKKCIENFGPLRKEDLDWAESTIQIFCETESRSFGTKYLDPLWEDLLKWYVGKSDYYDRHRVLRFLIGTADEPTITKMLMLWFGNHPNDHSTYFEMGETLKAFFQKTLARENCGKYYFGVCEKRILKLIAFHKDVRLLQDVRTLQKRYEYGKIEEYGTNMGMFDRLFLETKNLAMIAETIRILEEAQKTQ